MELSPAFEPEILRIVFAMLRDGKPYCDPQIDYQARMATKNKARWLNMLRKANLLQDVVSRKAAEQLRGAADGGCTRAGAGLSRGGGRVHGEKRERRGKHAYRARRPPSSRA